MTGMMFSCPGVLPTTGWARLTATMRVWGVAVASVLLAQYGRLCPVALSLETTAGWTLGAALISAGRILNASIVVVRIRIAGFLGVGVEGRGFSSSVCCCLFDTVLLRGLTTR